MHRSLMFLVAKFLISELEFIGGLMAKKFIMGEHCIIGDNVVLGENVRLGHNVIIENDVCIGNDVFIDNKTIIRKGVTLGDGSTIGANCIVGELQISFDKSAGIFLRRERPLSIGHKALIRSNTIIYGGSEIGDYFQTGHNVMIREKSIIGNYVSVGNYSDIQGSVKIGNYVRLHSNDRVEQFSQIDDYVWIFPGVELTNDPTPPSNDLVGVHVHSFAIICARALILAGREVMGDSLVAAGAVVTKDVEQYTVVAGNPARVIADVRDIRSKITGRPVYPWRYYFDRAMPWEDVGYDLWQKSKV